MSATFSQVPQNCVIPGAIGPGLTVEVSRDGDVRIVDVRGEFDIATGNIVLVAVTARPLVSTVVDISGVTFMDCSGYGYFVECRLFLEGAGRTLTLIGPTGQPARLLELIASV